MTSPLTLAGQVCLQNCSVAVPCVRFSLSLISSEQPTVLYVYSLHYRHCLAVPAAAPCVPWGLPPAEGTGLCEEDHEDPEWPQSDVPVWWRGAAGSGCSGPPQTEQHSWQPRLSLQVSSCSTCCIEHESSWAVSFFFFFFFKYAEQHLYVEPICLPGSSSCSGLCWVQTLRCQMSCCMAGPDIFMLCCTLTKRWELTRWMRAPLHRWDIHACTVFSHLEEFFLLLYLEFGVLHLIFPF